MIRLALALGLFAAACAEGQVPQVATGVPDDLGVYECLMRRRQWRCASAEFIDPGLPRPGGELGGPGTTCSDSHWLYPNGGCHDPAALDHCLRGIRRRARTCDEPMPAACAYVHRPC